MPFRHRDDQLEICLITTRTAGRWSIPKGFIDPGDTAAEERFKEVSAAYDVVGDEEKRAKYDEVRRLGPMAGGFGGPGGAPGSGFNVGFDDIGETRFAAGDRAGVARASLTNATAIELATSRADYVIVMFHAGTEYSRGAIDAGADVAIARHPHVLQPRERYNGGVILYSSATSSSTSIRTTSRRSAADRSRRR